MEDHKKFGQLSSLKFFTVDPYFWGMLKRDSLKLQTSACSIDLTPKHNWAINKKLLFQKFSPDTSKALHFVPKSDRK